jgi:D-alanine-D-alanine ligase-like ATP-grasp enzyme
MHYLVIYHFLLACIRNKVLPWRFFQLNKKFFSEEKGMYSKHIINEMIPPQWKLKSLESLDISAIKKLNFPVFIKPEWGQNAAGVMCIPSKDKADAILKTRHFEDDFYIVQESANMNYEYDIFYIRSAGNPNQYSVLTITQLCNTEEKNPVNSIHNKNTSFKDITDSFNKNQKDTVWKYIEDIASFSIAKVGIMTNSSQDLIEGSFKVIEINLFTPLPLNILDTKYSKKEVQEFIKETAQALSLIVKKIPKTDTSKNIFWSKYKKLFILKYLILKKVVNTYIYSYIDRVFLKGCSQYNNLSVRKNSRSKYQARSMFQKHDIPHASGLTFFWPFKLLRFIKKHGFPIVIKPNVSGFSRGSYFPICNYKQAFSAFFLAKIWWPISVVESYLEGENYRILVYNNEITTIAKRTPGFIIGDAIHTISELIDTENKTRKKMNLFPVVSPLLKSNKVKRYLKKQGYTFSSIPEKGKYIPLCYRITLEEGGSIETLDINTIPQKNKKLFIKVLNMFNATIFGIDAIFEKGIETPFDEQKCIFLEVNSRPYLKMHDFPRYGEKPNLESFYKKINNRDIQDKNIF